MATSRLCGGCALTIWPSNHNSPSVTSSRPAIMFSVVDLPQPEGPSSTTNSLSRISRLRSSTASTSPAYRLVTDLNSMRAMVCPLSALDGAGGQARHDVALEHQRQDDRRNDGQHAGRVD